jgi:GNAT superfamily N-acetyltransferase
MNMENLSLTRIKGPGQWIKLYQLYRSAFPEYERKPLWMILNMRRKGKMDVWYCRHGDTFVGLAITLNGEDLILLDYFAVVPGLRSGGFGSALLQKVKELYPGKGLFVEIESVYEDCDNKAQRIRRKHFYETCGMTSMEVFVWLFGVKMELMGFDCSLSYEQYHAFYRDNYNQWAASHIQKAEK